MKKLRVDQKIIVIAYALDLLMPFNKLWNL